VALNTIKQTNKQTNNKLQTNRCLIYCARSVSGVTFNLYVHSQTLFKKSKSHWPYVQQREEMTEVSYTWGRLTSVLIITLFTTDGQEIVNYCDV